MVEASGRSWGGGCRGERSTHHPPAPHRGAVAAHGQGRPDVSRAGTQTSPDRQRTAHHPGAGIPAAAAGGRHRDRQNGGELTGRCAHRPRGASRTALRTHRGGGGGRAQLRRTRHRPEPRRRRRRVPRIDPAGQRDRRDLVVECHPARRGDVPGAGHQPGGHRRGPTCRRGGGTAGADRRKPPPDDVRFRDRRHPHLPAGAGAAGQRRRPTQPDV